MRPDPSRPNDDRLGFGPFNGDEIAAVGADLGSLFHSVRQLGIYDPSTLPRTVVDMARRGDAELPELYQRLFLSPTDGNSKIGDIARSIEILAIAESRRHGYLGSLADAVEIPRPPTATEPLSIAPDEMVVFPKMSQIEFELRNLQRSNKDADIDDVVATLRARGVAEDKIASRLEAHETHRESLRTLTKIIPEDRVHDIYSLGEEQIRALIQSSKLVVVPSGDDHAKRVSHFVDDQLVLFINSDPRPNGSRGAHAYFTADHFGELAERLKDGNYLVEDWTRIETRMGDKILPLCLSEVAIADRVFDKGSKMHVTYRGESYVWEGSGGVVSTGYGSTGWFKSATRYASPLGNQIWPRTSPLIGVAQREVYGDVKPTDLLIAMLEDDEVLTVTSALKRQGVVSIDAIHQERFPFSEEVQIRRSEKPLKVISDAHS